MLGIEVNRKYINLQSEYFILGNEKNALVKFCKKCIAQAFTCLKLTTETLLQVVLTLNIFPTLF